MSEKVGSNLTFEDCFEVIEEEVAKRRHKWQLNSIAHIDFDDVSQILKLHIYNKWHLWDQSRPFKNWVNTVISNQIINLVRNHYGNLAPPCNKCPMNQGANLCSQTPSGEKCAECPLYAKWEKSKKHGYELRLPSSIDDPDSSASFCLAAPEKTYSFENSLERFDKELKKVLSESNYKVFRLLFIEKHSEEEVAKEMGFTSNEEGRKAGYKQIYNIKKQILSKAKNILKTKEIFYE